MAALLILIGPGRGHPCGPAPPRGSHVHVVSEEALILWNPEKKRQHFIRRASFDSDAPEFGFLVPTPSKPELAEASDSLFDTLADLIAPPVVYDRDYELVPTMLVRLLWSPPWEPRMPLLGTGVRVLEEKRVAGYDAAVLRADDAKALQEWLESHGYDSRAELVAWLEPYVRSHWIVTAFKIATEDPGARRVGTSAVRMSFATDEPFFPYREPADQRELSGPMRTLRVFVVAPFKVEGAIGRAEPWKARLLYASRHDDLKGRLRDAAAVEDLGEDVWLSAFLDESSPRPGTDDLFFSRAGDQAQVLPPPRVVSVPFNVPLPIDVVLVVMAALVWWQRRRATAQR